MILVKGSLQKSIYIRVVGSTSSTTPGDPVTGLTFEDVASIYYFRPGGYPVTFSVGEPTGGVTDPWTQGLFVEVSSAGFPGVYRLDVPNAAIAHGAETVIFNVNFNNSNNVSEPVLVNLVDDVDVDTTTILYALNEVSGQLDSVLFATDTLLSDTSTLITDVGAIAVKTSRILGLSKENMYVDQVSFNDSGRMISSRIRIYSSDSFTPDVTTPIAIYQNTITYDTDGTTMLTWKTNRIA